MCVSWRQAEVELHNIRQRILLFCSINIKYFIVHTNFFDWTLTSVTAVTLSAICILGDSGTPKSLSLKNLYFLTQEDAYFQYLYKHFTFDCDPFPINTYLWPLSCNPRHRAFESMTFSFRFRLSQMAAVTLFNFDVLSTDTSNVPEFVSFSARNGTLKIN